MIFDNAINCEQKYLYRVIEFVTLSVVFQNTELMALSNKRQETNFKNKNMRLILLFMEQIDTTVNPMNCPTTEPTVPPPA